MKFDKIFILGAGAVGSIIGALLSHRNDVVLVGTKDHMDAVRLNGLSISGDIEETFHVQTDTQIREIPQKTLILLTTKTYDSEKALKSIVNHLRKDTVILILQNGLGNEDTVKCVVGSRSKILRGMTTMAAELLRPGEIRYWKGTIVIEHDLIAERVADILNASGLRARLSKNIKGEIWNKVIVNSVINPLTAIFRVRNCEIGTKSLSIIRHGIVKECIQVGKAEGMSFSKNLEWEIDKEITSYSNFSSMYQDIMKGKVTEIDSLNGKIVDLGRKHHVPTPINETLVHFIKFLEEKNEPAREN